MAYSLLYRLVTPQVTLTQQNSSPLFIVPVTNLVYPCGKPYMSLWQTLFAPMADLICPCGRPYMPLWQTLYAPVADLICPCGRPYLPLWQTLHTSVANPPFSFYLLTYPFIPSIYCCLVCCCPDSLRSHCLLCWCRARFTRNFILYPPSMIHRLLHRLVTPQVSLLHSRSLPSQ